MTNNYKRAPLSEFPLELGNKARRSQIGSRSSLTPANIDLIDELDAFAKAYSEKERPVKIMEDAPMLLPDKPSKDWRVRTQGVKHDKNKPQPVKGLLSCFPNALEDISKVSEYGANKYSWDGWRTVPNGLNRYKEAQLRHMLQVSKGEELDEGSKMLHLTHSAWNALAVLELYLAQKKSETKEINVSEEPSKDVGQESPRDALRATENTHNNKYSFWGIVGR